MYSLHSRLFWLQIIIIGCFIACGDIVPIWVATQDLEDYTLYNTTKPCSFPMIIDPVGEKLTLRLELEITYDIGIARNELPLRLVILEADSGRRLSSTETQVILKAEGEWLGIPQENEIDYTITHNAIPELSISPGNYLLEVYSNENKEKVYGVINITARLYEISA